MKKLLIFFIMCFVAICDAHPTKLYHEQFYGPYDTIQAAAQDALQKSFKLSDHFEFGGLIVENIKNKKFYYTQPHTDFSIDSVYMDHNVIYPNSPEYKMVGDFHTHPCYPYSHYPKFFSSNDVFIYQYNLIQGYMANGCDGNIIHWDPFNLNFLSELDDPDGLFGIEPDSAYEGEIVGKISLNKTPDIQESILQGLIYFLKLKENEELHRK